MVVTTIETRETTASDSSSDHRDYWCSRDAPQPLVSNDSPPGKATSGSPQVHYRAPWPITSPVVKKVSLQSSPPATGNWPQRSPIKPEHEHEVASFALFTQSFDTLSEAGHTSLRPSPEHPPRKIQLAETEDISPIKLQEYKSSRQYVDAIAPPNFRPADTSTYNANGYSDTASNPFFVLRSVAKAFDHCSYQLPCLYDGELCPVHLSRHSTVHRYQEAVVMGEKQLERARRRVDSAIYAFGGYTQRSQAIFRSKPNGKDYYDNCFHKRYIVAGNHISWELEHHPPIRLNAETRPNSELYVQDSMQETEGPSSTASTAPMDANQQKMRYRCKLCGQLKQNHNCPYQQSLQRSIAVMVYPAVNAYTASEPGILTKPLVEMNNFVSYDDSSEYRLSPHGGIPHITPETKARLLHYSPESSLSTHSDPSPHRSLTRKRCVTDVATPPSTRHRGRPPYPVSHTLTLRPEHYRAVTSQEHEDFQYPHVPLSFQERKRLSDTLFYLAKEIPTMTAEVGPLLRLAREHDDWDLAVAQILTQLVVALYCAEGDTTLEGLQRYLLMIGISC